MNERTITIVFQDGSGQLIVAARSDDKIGYQLFENVVKVWLNLDTYIWPYSEIASIVTHL